MLRWWVEKAQLLHGCPLLPAVGQYSRHPIAAAKRRRSSGHAAARRGKPGMPLERLAGLRTASVVRSAGRSTRPVSGHGFHRAEPASDEACRLDGTSQVHRAPIPQRDGATERWLLDRDSHQDDGCGGGQSVEWSFGSIPHAELMKSVARRIVDW